MVLFKTSEEEINDLVFVQNPCSTGLQPDKNPCIKVKKYKLKGYYLDTGNEYKYNIFFSFFFFFFFKKKNELQIVYKTKPWGKIK